MTDPDDSVAPVELDVAVADVVAPDISPVAENRGTPILEVTASRTASAWP